MYSGYVLDNVSWRNILPECTLMVISNVKFSCVRGGSVNFIDGDDIPSLTFEITCRKSSCWDETIQMRGL